MKGMIFITPIPADREAAEVELAEKLREISRASELLDRPADELSVEEGLTILGSGCSLGGLDESILLEQRILMVQMGAQKIMRAYHDANKRAPNRKSMKDSLNGKLMKEARIQVARELGAYDVEILIEHDPDRFENVIYESFAKNMGVGLSKEEGE